MALSASGDSIRLGEVGSGRLPMGNYPFSITAAYARMGQSLQSQGLAGGFLLG